jgi:hypothetical protein
MWFSLFNSKNIVLAVGDVFASTGFHGLPWKPPLFANHVTSPKPHNYLRTSAVSSALVHPDPTSSQPQRSKLAFLPTW